MADKGRPPKGPDEVLSESFEVSVTRAEKAALAYQAALAGMPLSRWARKKLQSLITQEPAAPLKE